MNPILTKNYALAAAIAACIFVKAGAADGQVVKATDGSLPIIGVTEQVEVTSADYTAGRDRVDVIHLGIAYVKLGGTVTRGKWLTADANGYGVEATFTAGTEVHVGGIALTSGVSGDIVPVMIHPTVVATDTGIATVDVTVSAAEMLALNATPKQLVAAPGAGFGIVLESAQFFLDYNSAAYAGIAAGEDLAIKVNNAAGATLATVEATGFLDATADAFRFVRPTTAADVTPVSNVPLVLHMLTGEVTTGNSPLKVRVRYQVLQLAFA